MYHLVLPQQCSGLSLVGDGEPDVGEGGEVVAEALTQLHLDGLTRRGLGGEGGVCL